MCPVSDQQHEEEEGEKNHILEVRNVKMKPFVEREEMKHNTTGLMLHSFSTKVCCALDDTITYESALMQ